MPFGLTNTGTNFQHTMDYDFRYLIRKLIEIYQDDLTSISKKREQHIQHLINQEPIEVGEKEHVNIVVSEIENNEWYSYIVYYLKSLTCPDHLVEHKRRALRLKAMKYCLTENGLEWRNLDGVIPRCVDKKKLIG
jgi:hypothetical protein